MDIKDIAILVLFNYHKILLLLKVFRNEFLCHYRHILFCQRWTLWIYLFKTKDIICKYFIFTIDVQYPQVLRTMTKFIPST